MVYPAIGDEAQRMPEHQPHLLRGKRHLVAYLVINELLPVHVTSFQTLP